MTASSVQTTDVVNAILGIDDSSPVAQLRNQKPQLAAELQEYYDSLFVPTTESAAAFPLADRFVTAVRVASFTNSEAVANWYADLADQAGVPAETVAQARDTATPWTGNTQLDATIRHTDLLTTSPSDARPESLQALKDAGLTPAAIVSMSQTIAFVNYQLRLIAGLRAFGGQS